MFYAHFVLSKKGPLARIWLAAHWDKKLTKAHIFETNIESSVEAIIQPQVKLALRTSGHLLLGVVRIYSRKAKYLLADCNEAFIKIKLAFRPGVVDLPEENREAAMSAITLPETFHDFELEAVVTVEQLPEFADADILYMNQSRPEAITLREQPRDYMFNYEDGFGDFGFSDGFGMVDLNALAANQRPYSNALPYPSSPSGGSSVIGKSGSLEGSPGDERLGGLEEVPMETDAPPHRDKEPEFLVGADFGESNFPTTPLRSLARGSQVTPKRVGGQLTPKRLSTPEAHVTPKRSTISVAPLTPKRSVFPVTPKRSDVPTINDEFLDETGNITAGGPRLFDEHEDLDGTVARGGRFFDDTVRGDTVYDEPLLVASSEVNKEINKAADKQREQQHQPDVDVFEHQEDDPPVLNEQTTVPDQTTLIANDAEAFALGPIDVTAVGTERKTKKKRKLIVDDAKSLSSEIIRTQLSRTTDITAPLDLAPPTKKLMRWKELGGMDKLFHITSAPIISRVLQQLHSWNLKTRPDLDDYDASVEEDKEGDVEAPRGGVTAPTDQLHVTMDEPELARRSMRSNDRSIVVDHSRVSMISLGDRTMSDVGVGQNISDVRLPSLVSPSLMNITDNLQTLPPQGFPLDNLSLLDLPPMNDSLPTLPDLNGSLFNVTLPSLPALSPLGNLTIPELPPMTPQADRASMELPRRGKGATPLADLSLPALRNLATPLGDRTLGAVSGMGTPLGDCTLTNGAQTPFGRLPRGSRTPQSATRISRRMLSLPPLDPLSPLPVQSPSRSRVQTPVSSVPHDVGGQTVGPTPMSVKRSIMSVIEEEGDAIFNEGVHRKSGPRDSRQIQQQLEEEETEAERRLGKRSTRMLDVLHGTFSGGTTTPLSSKRSKNLRPDSVSFKQLIAQNNRKQVTAKFYTLLVLKKLQAIDIRQDEAFGDIAISAGSKFDIVK